MSKSPNIRHLPADRLAFGDHAPGQRARTAHIVSMRFSFAFAAKKKRKLT
jgi:hypothetical protein